MSIWFKQADQLILPVVMVITGLSFITLLSLQDPLRDWFLAKSTFYYFIAGIIGIILLLLFDLKRFTTDSKFYRLFVFSKMKLASNGWPWAIIASGLLHYDNFIWYRSGRQRRKSKSLWFSAKRNCKVCYCNFSCRIFCNQ